MPAARLVITVADGLTEGATIVVEVDHDDGYLAYATLHGRGVFRCYANTAERTVRWETKAPDGEWDRIDARTVDLPVDLKVSMARAAHAGLVACGARSVS